MREVQEKLYDDLLFNQNGEKVEAGETIEFSIDGEAFTIDLTGDNAELFREQFRPFKEAATPVTKRTGGGSKKGPKSSAAAGGAPAAPSAKKRTAKETDEENQRIREWARGQGFELSDRGRLPQHIRDAWAQAQVGNSGGSGEVVHDRLTDEQPPSDPAFDFTADSGGDDEVESQQAEQTERV